MKRRAESQEQTRQRITESAVALHGTLGPAHTSMSAVAEHAGVRRSTLYRHFPDEARCSTPAAAHWVVDNPPPDLRAWAAIARSGRAPARSRWASCTRYYGRTEQMLDEPAPRRGDRADRRASASPRSASSSRRAATCSWPGAGCAGARRRRTQAAIGHAIAFSTWKSLVREQGLERCGGRGLDALAGCCGLTNGRRRPRPVQRRRCQATVVPPASRAADSGSCEGR